MKVLCKILVFCLFAAEYSASQEIKQNKRIPAFMNTRDTAKYTKIPSGNLIKAENKAIQLKILSGDNSKNKVELLMAATQQRQATEESSDRYSPTYNSEVDMGKERSSANLNEDLTLKSLEPSRQDQSSFYSPEEFADIIPFAAMRSLLPQSLFANSNQFSPIQNIRHLEQNFEREVLPRALGNGDRSLNDDIPLDMIVTHPAYPQSMVSNYGHHPNYQADPYVRNGGQQVTHQAQPFHGIPVREPIPIIQSAPMPIYPLVNPTPAGRPSGNSQIPYNQWRPEYEPTYLHSQVQNQDRMPNHRDYYIPKTSPKNHLDQQFRVNREQDRHRDPRMRPSIQTNPNSEYRHQDRMRPQTQISDLQKNLYHSPHHARIPQVSNEQTDRNRYYTPLHQEPRQRQSESDHRSQNYPMLRHPQHSNYRTINMIQHKPDLATKLEQEVPSNKQTYRQVPHYTLVPRESLPKYLQNDPQNQPQTVPSNLRKNQEHHRPLSLTDQARLMAQQHSKQHNVPLSLNEEKGTVPHETLRPVYHPHRSFENGMRLNQREYQNEYPQQNAYSHLPHDALHHQVPEENSLNNHAIPSRGRPTYDLTEVDLDILPRKKHTKKGRKRVKSKKDDLEKQSSHQYIIKIL